MVHRYGTFSHKIYPAQTLSLSLDSSSLPSHPRAVISPTLHEVMVTRLTVADAKMKGYQSLAAGSVSREPHSGRYYLEIKEY